MGQFALSNELLLLSCLIGEEDRRVYTRCPLEGWLAGLFELTVRRTLQGSLIPGSNYSAQDDHAGVRVAGM
jgi:hypothetical protein